MGHIIKIGFDNQMDFLIVIAALKKQGSDPFQNFQLPNAVLTLKQGAGRLIRDITDRGVLMIGDPRLVGARYGETFLKSLPEMPRTRELNKVIEFFKESVTPCHSTTTKHDNFN